MRPLRQPTYEDQVWSGPALVSFTLTAEELSRIENASNPQDELVKVYRAYRSKLGG